MKFNVFPRKHETVKQDESLEPYEPNWDSTKAVPFAGEKKSFDVEEEPIDPSLFSYQEDKILRALYWQDPKHFGMLNKVPDEEYNRMLNGIKKGAYDDEFYYDDMFRNLPASQDIEKAKSIRGLYEGAVKTLHEKAETYAQIPSERIDELLQKTEIDGDPFPIGDEKHVLTAETLANAGLAPHYETNIDGTSFNFSKCFKVQGRDACLAYVETPDGKVKPRAYYRSNSAGLWRYCPDYGYNSGHGIWFGKGNNEEALTLPPELQKRLSTISEMDKVQPEGRRMADFCFFGTAKFYQDKLAHSRAKTYGELRGDFYEETDKKCSFEFVGGSEEKAPPEELDYSEEIAPNYHQEILSYKSNSKIYGDFTTRVYPSHDGSLLYSLCETEINGERQAWIGNIETSAKVGSTGCRTKWGYNGDLSTPLYEYPDQTGGYGEWENSKGSYVSMWKNYLSKMPFIKRYIEETGEKPEK
ncbi:hypothetical protein IJS18_01660 [Candidatus Saccharibacteria bacterium]|nr:hypothetical protein [Candidatus Saccharibacteria bacterium]